MADPILNESMILSDLDKITSVPNVQGLKHAVKLSLIDAFDRRPDREPFGDLVDEATSLFANMSRLEFADSMRKLLSENKLTKELLDGAVKSLTEVCETKRAALLKLFKPVTEMRRSGDPLN